eukprot:3750672-Rhodomonas_salina.1
MMFCAKVARRVRARACQFVFIPVFPFLLAVYIFLYHSEASRPWCYPLRHAGFHLQHRHYLQCFLAPGVRGWVSVAVSYTHLTLPTICSV